MMTFAEMRRRVWHGTVDHLDAPLVFITLAIMSVGLATVFSATYDSQNRLMGQFINMAVALGLMWGVAQVPPQKLMRFAVPLYVLGLVLLVLVFLFGIKVNGARRWLNIGITRIQPSEIMKLAMPLMLAWYFHKYEAA
ncbi:MAG: rod shape determining protein RodA, partial [Pseudomonadota bacterium]|nr:rod shape determining protein RodA [Pseudomonadota bacterium]